MKKIINIFCTVAALLAVFACQEKQGQETRQTVDLRYRAMDSYDVAATSAQAINILVVSTDPWTVTSDHPDWCIISQEEGPGSDREQVHLGQAESTSVRIQYYDNPSLEDREDKITIQSEYWVGKVITVRQKGLAFLTIPDADLDQTVIKGGGEYTIHIKSNQNWTAKVTEGDWINITDGLSGSLDGDIVLSAENNPKEKRYASITIYDRHNVAMYVAKFTQEGLQLDLAKTELRTDYNQASVSVDIVSNAKWTVAKSSEADDWFTIDNTSGNGNGTIKITLTPNDEDAVRKADLIVKNVIETEGEYQAEKTIVLKQAYHVVPKRYYLDKDEMSLWKSDQANAPVYTAGVGTFFNYPSRLNRGDMPMGTYSFCWSNIQTNPEVADAARARHWFCFSESAELKCDLRPFDDGGKIGFSFNAAGDGNKPSPDTIYEVDFSQPVVFTVKFEPNNVFYTDDEGNTTEYCHVQFYVNDVPGSSFDTSHDLFRTCYWGAKINMYVGMYNCGSGVCEWYEYSEPIEWN